MNLLRFAACFLVTALVTACATYQGMVPVTDSATRLDYPGYSVLPPQGDNWFLRKWHEGSAVFIKKVGPNAHTFSTAVMAVRIPTTSDSPEQFKESVRKSKQILDPKRYSILNFDVSLDPKFGAYCVKYYMMTRDRAAQVSRADTAFMFLEITGYTFVHPDSSNFVLDVNYSERYKMKGGSDPEAKKIGEKFINGLKIRSLK